MTHIFLKKINNLIDTKKCSVGIIGLGYVGLPLSILFVKNNFKIIGFDVDKKKIAKIKKNQSYIERISNNDVGLINKGGQFYSNFSNISKCDIIIICVPTPLKKNYSPDLSFIKATIDSIKKFLKKGQVIVLESTSYPGTTKDEIYKKIKKSICVWRRLFSRVLFGKN